MTCRTSARQSKIQANPKFDLSIRRRLYPLAMAPAYPDKCLDCARRRPGLPSFDWLTKFSSMEIAAGEIEACGIRQRHPTRCFVRDSEGCVRADGIFPCGCLMPMWAFIWLLF